MSRRTVMPGTSYPLASPGRPRLTPHEIGLLAEKFAELGQWNEAALLYDAASTAATFDRGTTATLGGWLAGKAKEARGKMEEVA